MGVGTMRTSAELPAGGAAAHIARTADAAGKSRIAHLPDIIEIAGLSKVYDTAQRGQHVALKEIALNVSEGQFVSILGPSGCGKSTLLYILGGFVDATTGSVRVSGKPIS